jgi:predicted permease
MDGDGAAGPMDVYIEGQPLPPGEHPPLVMNNSVDPAYFQTMRVPILRGRAFLDSDNESAPLVAIINETMANRFWPGQDPISERFSRTSAAGPFLQVVGIARDGKYLFIAENQQPYFYVPQAQYSTSTRTIEVRSTVSPGSLISPVERDVHRLDAGMPIVNLQTMEQFLEGGDGNGFFLFRLGASLAASIGILGLILAAIGVYGVLSYAARQRTHEIGVRMALGASRRDVLKLLFRQGASVIVPGMFAGLFLAWALTRTLGRLLVGVRAGDPLTYTCAAILLATVALLACYIAARRAMRVDPMVALRHE